MSRDYVPIEGEAKPARAFRNVIIAVVIAFLAGLVAMGWFLKSWNGGAGYLGRQAPAAKTDAVAELDRKIDAQGMVASPPVRAVVDPQAADELTARVRDLEQRMARISVSAEAASGNAARAEGLLVAFAARRALDRGVALGYIEGQLRDRFGNSQPREVATVIAAARQPITLEELQISLNELGPELAGGGADASWWDGFRREMSELFVIRKAGTPSPAPTERLSRAKRRLAGGQVDAALAEVARMPGRARAENWMAAARRYIEARRALDAIETAAILSPRTLRTPEPAPAAPTAPAPEALPAPQPVPATPAAPTT
ncbi:hypothetical protein [Sphingomonas cavernae]|uniref:hypothetical protein n=1 Tax=Sphingomonas cavernae TaxID=2320861 RepID=UPI0016000361|nr:hypothetical protein [Sphingomonas cavernae]